MDCRSTVRDGKPAIDFSWEGFDEGDLVGGRGWAVRDGDTLHGHLYFHLGDDSSFVAKRQANAQMSDEQWRGVGSRRDHWSCGDGGH